ncbi:hypothetical protein ACFQ51_25255 [Streptomyces kaempferi]
MESWHADGSGSGVSDGSGDVVLGAGAAEVEVVAEALGAGAESLADAEALGAGAESLGDADAARSRTRTPSRSGKGCRPRTHPAPKVAPVELWLPSRPRRPWHGEAS